MRGALCRAVLPETSFFVPCKKPIDKSYKICYSITTLSPLIVIYRQVMPNHRKIGAFGGRKVKNRAITGNRKNRKSEDFW